MLNCIIVGLGGFTGAVCRYLVGLLPVKETTLFPIKTFGINVVGCIFIGLIVVLASKGGYIGPKAELFLKVGLCGGFTTFSTFALETSELMKNGHTGIAMLYVILSIVVGTGVIMLIQSME